MDGIVDALYMRFLLRDIFGKIVPGWIVLTAIASRFPETVGLFTVSVPSEVTRTVLGAGVAWLTAFAMQEAAQRLGYLQYWTAAFGDARERYQARIDFHRTATPDEKHQHERLVVIKEAAGLGSVSLVLAAALLTSGLVPLGNEPTIALTVPFLLMVGGLLAAAVSLRASHKRHGENQFKFMAAVLRDRGCHVPGETEPHPQTTGAA
jgi:hypothetical protein